VALVWLVIWAPAYLVVYGFGNFLQLCDAAVILTCAGLSRGSSLLLSMAALTSLVIDILWDLDLGWRLATGRHWIGGTEYMWESRFPLWVRLLSLFHLVLPVVLLWALRRVGYDRRALGLQSLLALALLMASRCVGPVANVNFSWRDPFLHASLGPAPVHLAITLAGLWCAVYLPTHAVLSKVCPQSRES